MTLLGHLLPCHSLFHLLLWLHIIWIKLKMFIFYQTQSWLTVMWDHDFAVVYLGRNHTLHMNHLSHPLFCSFICSTPGDKTHSAQLILVKEWLWNSKTSSQRMNRRPCTQENKSAQEKTRGMETINMYHRHALGALWPTGSKNTLQN